MKPSPSRPLESPAGDTPHISQLAGWRGILGGATWLAVAALAGCESSIDAGLELAHFSEPEVPLTEVGLSGPAHPGPAHLDSDAPLIADREAAPNAEAYQPPYPERKNPFEFGAEYAGDGFTNEIRTDASTIRLFGFAGESPARAIINVGGRTKMLAEGERWGIIELIEVSPPQAKIRVDGVVRTWSLLGYASQTAGQ